MSMVVFSQRARIRMMSILCAVLMVSVVSALSAQDTVPDEDDNKKGLIEVYGLKWDRTKAQTPTGGFVLMGKRTDAKMGRKAKKASTDEADSANLSFSSGIYVLYDDNDKLVYVGKAEDGGLANRLNEHTRDHLADRWTKFSWFAVLKKLKRKDRELSTKRAEINGKELVAFLEGFAIILAEPVLNGKRNNINSIAYYQVPQTKP
jgi:hypothetical protein